jgi:hypothetical protein
LFKINWAVLSKGVNLQTTKSNINNFLPYWPSRSDVDFTRWGIFPRTPTCIYLQCLFHLLIQVPVTGHDSRNAISRVAIDI